jgi:hypothetical protein
MLRFILATGALAALTLSAAAQTSTTTTPAPTTGVGTTGEFYVVQDTATKKCTIVDQKPTTTTMVQVGPAAFKTRTEAESGMKSIQVCTTN